MACTMAMAQQAVHIPADDWLDRSTHTDPFQYDGVRLDLSSGVVKACLDFANDKFQELQDEKSELKLDFQSTSPLGYHVTFRQYVDGVRVLPSEIRFNIGRNGKVSSLFIELQDVRSHSDFNTEEWGSQPQKDEAMKVLAAYEGSLQPAWYYPETVNNMDYFTIEFSNGHRILSPMDRHVEGPKDSLVHAYVFNPDPLTKAQRPYSGQLRNFNDTDTDSLTAMRELLTVPMEFDEDSFWTRNEHVSAIPRHPDQSQPFSLTDTFDFTRGQDEFEYVNCVYHITQSKLYLKSLGFPDLMDYQLPVYPQARDVENGPDNSQFKPNWGPEKTGTLIFGMDYSKDFEHVEDAEDADVIIHEFGHAISYDVNGNDISRAPRNGIDEGFGDYLACSYSKSISTYKWEELFSWDAHNPFWEEGRSCVTKRTYDDYKLHNLYENGEILAGMGMELWDMIGRKKSDHIVVGSAHYYAEGMSFRDAGLLLLKADSALYDGMHSGTICALLLKYKFVDEDFCVLSGHHLLPNALISIDAFKFQNGEGLHVKSLAETELTVHVYSMDGKIVYASKFEEELHTGSLSNRSGIYLVSIQGKNISVSTKLVRL